MANKYNSSPVFLGGQFAPFLGGQHSRFFHSEFEIFILSGSFSDLSKFNFEVYNLQCIQIGTKKFEEAYSSLTKNQSLNSFDSLFDDILNNSEFNDLSPPHALLPIDLKGDLDVSNPRGCYEILLLLFPGDLSIYSIVHCELHKENCLQISHYSEYGQTITGRESYYDNYLYYDPSYLKEINAFIVLFHSRKDNIGYLDSMINSYISSFIERNPKMAFITQCIALESITDANTELSFRIKRNVSIICADTQNRAENIYDNLNLIYQLRSKIVHSGTYNNDKVFEYLPYLQSLVSRLIIELVLINEPDLKTLNRKLIFSGFGNRKSLNNEKEGYDSMTLNINTFAELYSKKL